MGAYQVKLPVFEGPFDLLYHLIEEQKLNIYDIPIAPITAQYLDYLQMMDILDMEIASSFLVMAATLLEIKSKLLLPKEKPQDVMTGDEDLDEVPLGDDARTGLVGKLIEYRRFKLIALELRELERQSSRIYTRSLAPGHHPEEILQINLTANDIYSFFQSLIRRRLNPPVHRVILDKMNIEERIEEIRQILRHRREELAFRDVVKDPKSRYDLVLSLMAVLEMAKSGEISISQSGNFKPIFLRPPVDEPVPVDAAHSDGGPTGERVRPKHSAGGSPSEGVHPKHSAGGSPSEGVHPKHSAGGSPSEGV